MMCLPIYNIIDNEFLGDIMKLKDISTNMSNPSQKQQLGQKAKKRDDAPTSGALFKAILDKEKAK